MIDHEPLIPLGKAAKFAPNHDGRPASYATLHRWCTRGIRGVRLECLKAGKTWCTSREALTRFFRALAEAELPGAIPPAPARGDAARQREVAAALDAAGW